MQLLAIAVLAANSATGDRQRGVQVTGMCDVHGMALRKEPLRRFDGTQIGNLTLDVCDRCDDEADDNFSALIDRVVAGDLPVADPPKED